jgi:zinc D-Ala-D-Ala carboxypeptidase
MSTQVTMHFTIEELYASATAKAKGIDNKPNVQQIICLVYLAANVLEPLREAMKEPIKISSGFRCDRLNRAVGGVSNSQHTKGQAADICIDGDLTKGRRWFDYIKTHLQFDQLIWEHDRSGTYWIHVSYVPAAYGRNRKQVIDNLLKK